MILYLVCMFVSSLFLLLPVKLPEKNHVFLEVLKFKWLKRVLEKFSTFLYEGGNKLQSSYHLLFLQTCSTTE